MTTRSHPPNLGAISLLGAALGSFVIFHLLPTLGWDRGWEIWPAIGKAFLYFGLFDTKSYSIIASFLTITVLVVSSPFLTAVFQRSRLAWCLATVMAGLAGLGFIMVLMEGLDEPSSIGTGGWFLLGSPLLNFVGLLMARVSSAPKTPA